MPKIERVFTMEITPERFLLACSPDELKEVDLLLNRPEFMPWSSETRSKEADLKKLNEPGQA